MNRDELRAAIAKKNITRKEIADALGISNTGLSLKMSGRHQFKEGEIRILVSILGLTPDDVNRIFLS